MGLDPLFDRRSAGPIEPFPTFLELRSSGSGIRPVLPAEPQPVRIEGQVDVLRESLDDTEDF